MPEVTKKTAKKKVAKFGKALSRDQTWRWVGFT